jgi:hypothetical protein
MPSSGRLKRAVDTGTPPQLDRTDSDGAFVQVAGRGGGPADAGHLQAARGCAAAAGICCAGGAISGTRSRCVSSLLTSLTPTRRRHHVTGSGVQVAAHTAHFANA